MKPTNRPIVHATPVHQPISDSNAAASASLAKERLEPKGKKESRKKRFNFFLFWLVQIFSKLIQFLFHWKNLRLCRQRNFKVKFRETKDDLNTDQSTLLSKRYRRKTSLPFPRTIQWYWKRDNKSRLFLWHLNIRFLDSLAWHVTTRSRRKLSRYLYSRFSLNRIFRSILKRIQFLLLSLSYKSMDQVII